MLLGYVEQSPSENVKRLILSQTAYTLATGPGARHGESRLRSRSAHPSVRPGSGQWQCLLSLESERVARFHSTPALTIDTAEKSSCRLSGRRAACRRARVTWHGQIETLSPKRGLPCVTHRAHKHIRSPSCPFIPIPKVRFAQLPPSSSSHTHHVHSP